MAAEQRKLLEQLMGDTLSIPGQSKTTIPPITDPKVCRSYLAGTCPHDLFTNTKNDLGLCPKLHNEALKTEYEAASPEKRKEWGFEFDYMRDMQRYIDDCNRKIESAQRRLEKTPDEIRQTNALLKQISELTATIAAGLAEIKCLSELGMVNQAVSDHFKLRQTQQIKADRERELKALSDTSGPSGHQKLQVCDVCGAYLSRLDNDRRLADHFFGKMHLGYAQMRRTFEGLREELKGRAAPVREFEGGREDGEGGYGGGGAYGGRGGGFGRGGGGGFGRGRGRGGFGRW